MSETLEAGNEILVGETTPLDDTLAATQVLVNVHGDPIEIISGCCETLGYTLSEARDLRALLDKAIGMVEARRAREAGGAE